MHPLITTCFIALALVAGSARADEQRVTILTMEKPSGFQTSSYDGDEIKVRYEFNDRGRGPEIDATYAIGAGGIPTTISITGKSYFKVAVDERFTWRDGKAKWTNGADDAEVDSPSPRHYLTLNGPAEETAILARALLAAPQRKLAVLPSGEATIRDVASLKVKGKGGTVDARLYAIDGLGLEPFHIWLDRDGRFFATYSSWMSMVREGYEDSLAALAKRQQTEERAHETKQARALTTRIEKPLLIEPVRVFDTATLAVKASQAVLVVDGKIAAVGDAGSIALPRGGERFDGGDLFLSPGLWDMHAHFGGGSQGVIDIAGGVTTVRDLANDDATLRATIERTERGDAIGPRVIRAGFMDGRSPYSGPTKVFVDDEAEARAAIDKYSAAGDYEQIKVYSSLKPELVPVIAKLAHEKGMRLSGHVPSYMSTRQFVEAGADEVQHINFVVMPFVTDVATADTRTPVRFTAVAENAAALDLGSREMRDWIAFLAQRQTVIDPTISTFENMFLEQPGHPGPADAAWTHRLPPTWKRAIESGTNGLPMTRQQEATFRDSYARLVQLVGVLHRSGVPIVAGTDGIGGMAIVRELELYVQGGIPPAEALRIATRAGAEVMKRGETHGRVAPGYVADLILVDGDPTMNISDLRRVRTVIRGDRRFDSAALWRSLGIAPIADAR